MARNGSGTYSLPAGNPVVTGTSISSTWANNTLNDISAALTQSISVDGQTAITANLPMTGFKHTNVGNATARTEYCAAGQAQDNVFDWLTSVTGTDTITATGPIGLSAYAAGQCFRFTSAGANTGAVTININGIGAKSVTKLGATALAANDIPLGAVVEVVYDGTRFQISGLISYAATYQPLDAELTAIAGLTSVANTVPHFTGSGTANLLTVGTASGNLPLIGTSSATETLPGLVELATTAEVQTGTDTARAITAAGLTAAKIIAGTAVASTSGTSIDFTGIPSWAKRVTVMFSGVSLSGTANFLIQLGVSGGIESTGYVSTWGVIAATSASTGSSTAGFIIRSGAATTAFSGTVVIQTISANKWVCSSNMLGSTALIAFNSGDKTLAGTLTQLRITTDNGTDTFDAGSVNILYE